MTRINVYLYDEFTSERTLEGWFDPDSAIRYDQGKRWNGNNNVGVITGSRWVDEYLYRTPGGRWVLNQDAHRENNGPDIYGFIPDDEAHDWLMRSEVNDEAVEQWFGAIEDERGPGRPEVGPAFSLRFPADLTDRVDAAAKAKGIKRAALIRELVEAGLN
jgi:hypothetical protein